MTKGFRFSAIARKALAPVGVALAVAALPSCGDDTGLGKRYAVSGTVTYKDEPLESGQITFVPTTPSETTREASGTIEKGAYTLTTAVEGDGALPGDYKVKILARSVDDSKVKETINKQGGGGRQHEIAKAFSKGKNMVPSKYQLPETSGLTAKVAEQSNTIDFKLTD